MGFAPVNYSSMFDNINELTSKKDIVRALKRSTGKRKKYLEALFDLHKIHNDKIVWFIDDLEEFFNMPLNVMPFFSPRVFHRRLGLQRNKDKRADDYICVRLWLKKDVAYSYVR